MPPFRDPEKATTSYLYIYICICIFLSLCIHNNNTHVALCDLNTLLRTFRLRHDLMLLPRWVIENLTLASVSHHLLTFMLKHIAYAYHDNMHTHTQNIDV